MLWLVTGTAVPAKTRDFEWVVPSTDASVTAQRAPAHAGAAAGSAAGCYERALPGWGLFRAL